MLITFVQFIDQSVIVIKWMYFVCTTHLLTSHKNNPYVFHKVADLKKKKSNKISIEVGHNEQICGELLVTFRNIS